MDEMRWIVDVAKANGIGVLLFVALFFMLKYQAKAAKDQRQADAEREKQNFALLNGFLETLQCQIAQLSRIENKMDSNHFCPMVRRGAGND
jgi:hypothetical protein